MLKRCHLRGPSSYSILMPANILQQDGLKAHKNTIKLLLYFMLEFYICFTKEFSCNAKLQQ